MNPTQMSNRTSASDTNVAATMRTHRIEMTTTVPVSYKREVSTRVCLYCLAGRYTILFVELLLELWNRIVLCLCVVSMCRIR